MRYQIAVLGSHREDLPKKIYEIAGQTGKEIAKKGHILFTGTSTGISKYASKGAKSENGLVLGISPYTERKESEFISLENHDTIIFSGFGYKGRNVLTIKSADGVIIINGGFGTLNEVTIAEGENKPIVIIENTGEASQIIREIFQRLNPDYSKIRYVNNPIEAVNSLIEMIRLEKVDTGYVNNLTYFEEHSEENEVDSRIFAEKLSNKFSKIPKIINWLDVGAGSGIKLIKILEKIKDKYDLKLDIIEPSQKWHDRLIKNFEENKLDDLLWKKFRTTWEELNTNKRYDLITFFHSVYGIPTESLRKIPELLNENGIACIVVESPNSDLHKIKKSLFPYVHHIELISSSETITKFLEKKGINYKIEKDEPDQKFYVDKLLDKNNPRKIEPLSFILQTKPEDYNKLISKEIQNKIYLELKKHVKKDKKGGNYINVPDRFIWVYRK